MNEWCKEPGCLLCMMMPHPAERETAMAARAVQIKNGRLPTVPQRGVSVQQKQENKSKSWHGVENG